MAHESNHPLGRRLLNLQTLEAREVPATTIDLTGGIFSIANGNEAITLTLGRSGADYVVDISGGTFTPGPANPNITYNGPNTRANLVAAAGTLAFNLGGGDDTLIVGSGNLGDLTPVPLVPVVISVTGGGGADRIRLDDSTSAEAAEFTVAGSSVVRTTGAGLTEKTLRVNLTDTFAQATVTAGTGSDRIILATDGVVALPTTLSVTGGGGAGTDTLALRDTDSAGHAFQVTGAGLVRESRTFPVGAAGFEAGEIQGGTGADTITVVNLPTLSGGSAPVTVSGGGGNDPITVQNAGANAQLTVNGGGNNDTITVEQAAATATIAIFGGADNDTVRIGNAGNPISLIDASITVDGGPAAGNDQLIVDDRAATAGHTYEVKAIGAEFAVAHDASGTYRYVSIDDLTLRTSDDEDETDTIRVTATAARLTVEAGDGTNLFHIGSTAATLDGLGGDVSLAGGSDTDRLFVVDSSDTDPNTYVAAPGSVSRTAGAITRAIEFNAGLFNSVELTLGTPAIAAEFNTVTVTGTAANSPLTVTGGGGIDKIEVRATANNGEVEVEAGGGNDEVTVGAGNLSALVAAVTVDGEAGADDSLVVDDSAFNSARTLTIGGSTITSAGGAVDITYAGFGSLTLNAGTAGDTLRVLGDDLSANTDNFINGGAGADEITVVPVPVLPVTNVSIDIDGGGNPGANGDTLFVELDSVPDPFGVFVPDILDPSAGTAAVVGFVPFDYVGIEEVGLDTDAIALTGTAASDTLVVSDIADGSMKIQLGSAKALKVKDDTLVVWTAGSAIDADRVEFRDSTTAADRNFTVQADKVVRTGLMTILDQLRFEEVEEIILATGSGANVITVNAVPAATTLTVTAGAGDDAVNAPAALAGAVVLDLGDDNDSVNLVAVAKTVQIDGGAGNDTVGVGTASGATTVTGGTGADDLSIDTAGGALRVDAGDGDDTVLVGSAAGATTVLGGIGNDSLAIGAAAAAALRVDGGAGSDTVTAGAGGLDNWSASATLTGGADQDRMVVADPDSSDNSYRITAALVSRTTGATPRNFPYDPTDFEEVELRVGTGSNTVDIPATAAGAPVTVIGGTGDDAVVVGDGTLDAIGSAVSVVGGGGTDSLAVNDSTKATAQTYAVSNIAVTRAAIVAPAQAAVMVNYTGMDGVVLRAGVEGDTVTVATTAGGTTTSILAGAGDDTVTVGTGNLDNVDGPVLVDDAASLVVADGGVHPGRSYVISATEVVRSGSGFGTATVGFSAVGGLTVNAGPQADDIEVTATSAATPVAVNAGAGNDTVSAGGGNLDNLVGPLTLNPGGDAGDKLVVDDSDATAGKTYSVDGTDAGTAGHTFAYFAAGFREVELRGGLGADTIAVPAAAVPVTVIGGGGDDEITIGTGSLDAILAPVDVTGGSADNDRLTVNDQADAGAAAYVLGTSSLTRTQVTVSSITFNSVDRLVLNTTLAGDAVAINDTTAATTVNAGAGADAVTIANTSLALVVNAQDGADTVTVGAGDLGAIGSTLTVNGGTDADPDRLLVNDSTSGAAGEYMIGLTAVSRGAIAVNYAEFQTVELTAGATDDRVTVPATAADTTVVVNAGDGNDTIHVGGGDVDQLAGPLTLNAGAGAADRLIVDDSAEAIEDRAYTVNATKIIAAGYDVEYGPAGFERVELRGGAGDDTATVEGTATGIPVTVSAGLGADTVYVGTGNLDSIRADVTASGGGQAGDRLEVRDHASTTANTYTLTDATVVRSTPAPARQINHGAFSQVVLTAGTGADTVLVSSTLTSVPVTVSGGDGNDTVTVASFDNIRGPLNVFGGAAAAGADVLVADDSSSGTGKAYTVDAAQVIRTTGTDVPIDFGAVNQVVLKTGTAGDTVTVRAIAASVTASVLTGAGADAVTVGADLSLDAILGTFALDAAGGSDKLTVNDSTDSDDNDYVLTATSVTRNTTAPVISFATSAIEALELRAGTGNDTIAVKAASVPTTVNAGAGNDALSVGDGSLDNLLADVTLIGDTGTDGLLVDDSQDASDNAYEATRTTLTRTAGAPPETRVVNHNSFDTFALRAGLGSNVIDVLEMDKDVTIAGGAGNDTITLGSDGTGGFPAGLAGFSVDIDIAISAGGGADNQLTFDDAATTVPQKYTITPFALTPTLLAAPPGTNGPVFPYLGGFQQVQLQAGTGSDLVESDSAKGVNLSVDAGPGTNTFRVDYLGGSVFGGAGTDTFFGRKRETASLQDGASRFVIDGANAGTVADRLGGRFAGIENIVGGGLNDSFTFTTTGSLSGSIKGEGGTDELFGDNTARTYRLTGPGTGSVLGLTPNFEGIESIFGGIRDDILMIPNALPNDGLSVFDGGQGKDTANFTEWTSAKTVLVTGVGTGGFHLTDGPLLPAELDRHKFKNLDVVLGSPLNTDSLAQTTNIPTGWVVQTGGLSYMTEKTLPAVGGTAPDERLEFVGFERLNGGMGPDAFRVDITAASAGTPDLFVTGGISPRESDRQDRLEVLGTAGADTFKLLPRTQTFPTGSVGTTNANSVAGVQLTASGAAKPRLLYDGIRVVDLQAGAGNDTFVVEPPAKAAGATKANPLFGFHVRDLVLQGGAGNDRFEIVPDQYNTALNANKLDPRVDFHVFGGAGQYSLVKGSNGAFKLVGESSDATPTGQDTMILYQLPVRVKANFPLHGKFGPPTNQFELTKKQYQRGTTNYYDFFTIVASTKKKAADVVIPPPV